MDAIYQKLCELCDLLVEVVNLLKIIADQTQSPIEQIRQAQVRKKPSPMDSATYTEYLNK